MAVQSMKITVQRPDPAAAKAKRDRKALLEALREAERAMAASPAFNPWDLGPGKALTKVRAAIAKAED